MYSRKIKKSHSQCPSVAELYEAQPYYERFNQKYNMTRQELWKEDASKLPTQRAASMRKRVERGSEGFSVIDWAFSVGARTNLANTAFGVNWPNRQGNSWKSTSNKGR